jgi:hypothetical protein
MKTLLKHIVPAILIILFINSCIPDVIVTGNKEYVEDERTIPEFEKIHSSGSYYVFFEYADEPGIKLIGESNILPYIETYVSGSTLQISTPYNVSIHPHAPIEVYVKGPYVDNIKLSGSGEITTTDTINGESLSIDISGSGDIDAAFIGDNFNTNISGSGYINFYTECKNLSAKISGSGKIEATGTASYSEYNISGSGKIMALDCESLEASAHISGSGDMYIDVINSLTGSISGSGNIYYTGSPDINVNTSGSGSIRRYN